MTRLQKMLGKIKTVEELGDILGVSTSYILRAVALSKDEERLINCPRTKCDNCGFSTGGDRSRCNNYSMLRYFNAELPETVYTDTDSVKTTSEYTPIVKLRDSARKLIKSVVLEGFKQGYSALTVYRHIDEYIDVLEGIGLFEENELRTYVRIYVATDLTKALLNKKYGDSTE